ncbi:Protein piccolo [Labeo rohita]|uniref:Protein piccolo n=1 Tax=Labeo rohita TaxID=84645 RepID=A0ABQ8LPS0_LABRO|nr:Protein piccolo [Labeo rohita]
MQLSLSSTRSLSLMTHLNRGIIARAFLNRQRLLSSCSSSFSHLVPASTSAHPQSAPSWHLVLLRVFQSPALPWHENSVSASSLLVLYSTMAHYSTGSTRHPHTTLLCLVPPSIWLCLAPLFSSSSHDSTMDFQFHPVLNLQLLLSYHPASLSHPSPKASQFFILSMLVPASPRLTLSHPSTLSNFSLLRPAGSTLAPCSLVSTVAHHPTGSTRLLHPSGSTLVNHQHSSSMGFHYSSFASSLHSSGSSSVFSCSGLAVVLHVLTFCNCPMQKVWMYLKKISCMLRPVLDSTSVLRLLGFALTPCSTVALYPTGSTLLPYPFGSTWVSRQPSITTGFHSSGFISFLHPFGSTLVLSHSGFVAVFQVPIFVTVTGDIRTHGVTLTLLLSIYTPGSSSHGFDSVSSTMAPPSVVGCHPCSALGLVQRTSYNYCCWGLIIACLFPMVPFLITISLCLRLLPSICHLLTLLLGSHRPFLGCFH